MGGKGSGRRTQGRLYKRESGTWFLRYVVQGRDIRVSLDTKDARKARLKAAGYLHPVQARAEVARREAVAKALQDSTEALEQAEARANRLPLSEVWSRFPYDYTAPGRGARRALSTRGVEENRLAWGKFATWATGRLGQAACMEDVTTDIAREFSQWLHDQEHVTAGRHNKLLNVARVMYRLACRPDPFVAVPRYAVRYESRRNLEVPELARICQAATGELRRLFAVMLFTGLRVGDAVTLEWSNVTHGRVIRRMAKTGKDVALQLHPTLSAILNEVPEAFRSGPFCPDLAALYRRQPSTLSKRIRDHLESCGLVCVEDGAQRRRRVSRLGAHAFRHAFVTECARAGVPEGAIRDWVGHSSSAITRIYQHWGSRETDAKILAALPAAAFGAPAAPDQRTELLERIGQELPHAGLEELQAALQALEGDRT